MRENVYIRRKEEKCFGALEHRFQAFHRDHSLFSPTNQTLSLSETLLIALQQKKGEAPSPQMLSSNAFSPDTRLQSAKGARGEKKADKDVPRS